jgi:hypothetical protein
LLSCWSDINYIEVLIIFFNITNQTKTFFFLAFISNFYLFIFFVMNSANKLFNRLITIVQRKYVYLVRTNNFTRIIIYINIKNGLILITHIIIMKVDMRQS